MTNPLMSLPQKVSDKPAKKADPVKQKKADLKELKNKQADLKRAIESLGQNPTANQDYLDLSNQIFTIEQEIDSLKNQTKTAKQKEKTTTSSYSTTGL